jgi:hypothetical protein
MFYKLMGDVISYSTQVSIVQVNKADNYQHDASCVVFLRVLIILDAGNPRFKARKIQIVHN